MDKAGVTAETLRQLLRRKAPLSPGQVSRFFKTKPGEYAHHDQFLGVRVPDLRSLAASCSDVSMACIEDFLSSSVNEERFLALLFLIQKYQRASDKDKEVLCDFYIKHLDRVNNWNLVDASAHLILGPHLWQKDKSLLETLARSSNLWYRRVSIVSTWFFIKQSQCLWTYRLAKILLRDSEDLIHKATGWMLREAGKKNTGLLEEFLGEFSQDMPRTMLRYAIERFPQEVRLNYLTKISKSPSQKPAV